MNWLHYLLEANLYLAVFYAGYYLFLSRETYYTLNRIYLLFSCVASFVLPVLQLGILKPVEQPVTAINFSFPIENIPVSTINYVPAAQPLFTWQDGLVYAYILGAAVLLIMLLIKLYQLFRLTRVENLGSDDQYKIIYIDRSETAFSFFNYLFIGTKVKGPETIIQHELVHIRQKHSADIIFIELLKIVNWFNPVIYLMQYSLKTLHEYIADEKTAASGTDTLAYSSFLVNNAYGIGGASITNSFFNYNLLKKRIIMLNQKRSGSLARLKYLLAIPVCGGLLCASTLAFSKTYGWVDVGPHRIDKNNHSPQVAEPVKRLLVTRNGISTITDKFSAKRADGSIRVYTAYNLSNKDAVDLAKKGIQLTVIYDEDTTKTHTAPPPPPAPPVSSADMRPAPPPPAPPAKGSDDMRPPPPPPAPPVSYTKKGYKYRENGYIIKGKTDFRVIIITKSGTEKEYFKSKASAADLKLLKEKYGYTFPTMDIYTKLPPPPPAAPAMKAPKALIYKQNPADSTGEDHTPVVVVNGEIYKLKEHLGKGQQLLVDASGGENAVIYTDKYLVNAIAKYGPNAKYGVIFATGKTTVTITPIPPAKTGMMMQKVKGSIIKPKKADEGSVYSDISTRWEAIAFTPNKKGC